MKKHVPFFNSFLFQNYDAMKKGISAHQGETVMEKYYHPCNKKNKK